mmetsp:Transcript_49703/g.93207  ORF Transcript_49703/g.93207 Transcript_49703/m.93207 type:complete len:708 (-) Transcript_49703:80-2203(-)
MAALAAHAKAFVALCLALACAVAAVEVTPIEKVVQLLTGLEAQLEKEGKQEATDYDKYSCFCKDQADEKLYATEKSKKKIAELTAAISKLDGEILDLGNDIGNLNSEISGLEQKIEAATTARQSAHEEFLEKSQERKDAIEFVKGAIESIEGAKGKMAGKTKLDLTQARTAIKKIAPFETALLAKLERATPAEGDAHDYEFHSNEVHQALQDILAIFKRTLKRIETDEANAVYAFNSNVQALSNTKKFKTQEKNEKEALEAAKTEERDEANKDKVEEDADMTSDKEFLEELRKDCERKADLWDKRSKTRADELTALDKAISKLKESVSPNWSANKKLSDLQKASSAKLLHLAAAPVEKQQFPKAGQAKRRAVSFLQLRGSANGGSDAVLQVQQFLASAAGRLSSSTLTSAAMRVMVSKDHFVKVRGLIKDLIARLEADAGSESTTKAECDEEMAAATSSRDQANSDIESASAAISKLEAHNAELRAEIAELKAAVAALEKQMMEATQLREEEKAANERTVAMSDEALSGVDFAISVLSQFYDNAFIQKGAYVPPNSDREGKTIKDLSPEIFDSEYHGAQEASKGILGLLAVIKSDFARTKSTTETDESEAASEFETYESKTQTDIDNKNAAVESKEGTIADNEEKLTQRKDDLSDAKKMLANALETLENLHSKCVEGEETYAERVARREEEIAALKEALQMLIDWKR